MRSGISRAALTGVALAALCAASWAGPIFLDTPLPADPAVMRDGVIDETYLVKEQEVLRRSREEALQQNGFWLPGIVSALMNDEDPAELRAYYKRVNALDAEKVMCAARFSFTPARYVRVVLLPETAPAEAAP